LPEVSEVNKFRFGVSPLRKCAKILYAVRQYMSKSGYFNS
jgi:hypothetical protein